MILDNTSYTDIETIVVGVSFYAPVVDKLQKDQSLVLLRNPSNEYDYNAIEVKTLDGELCGHIPRDKATSIAPIIDKFNLNVIASVINISDFENKRSVKISFKIPYIKNEVYIDSSSFIEDLEKTFDVTLTEEQKKIIQHPKGSHAKILSVAGSGKTATMVMRIRYLIKHMKVDPASIQVLMFNKNIRKEFGERLKNHGIFNVNVNTFHSFAFRIITQAQEKGLIESCTLDEDESNSKERAHKILDEAIKNHMTNKKSKDSDYGRLLSGAKQAIQEWKNNLIPPSRAGHKHDKRIEAIYEEFERIRKDKNFITFDDFVPTSLNIFDKTPELKTEYAKFNFIIIDEYQDINYAQHKLLELISSEETDIMAVGDDDQTLYEWRGAHPEYIINKFQKIFNNKNVIEYTLSESFRFGPLIAQCASNCIQNNNGENRNQKYVLSSRFFEESYISIHDDNKAITNEIINMLKSNEVKPRDIIVLGRTWSQLFGLQIWFTDKIPYIVKGLAPFYKQDDVLTVLNYLELSCCYDSEDDSVKDESLDLFLKIVNKPKFRINKDALEQTLKVLLKEKPLDKSLLEIINNNEKYCFDKKQITNLESLMIYIRRANIMTKDPNCYAYDVLEHIVDSIKYIEYLEEYYGKTENSHSEIRIAAIEHLLKHAKEMGLPPQELIKYFKKLDTTIVKGEKYDNNDLITMTTVFRVKGEQFPVVIIPNCNDGYMPLLGPDYFKTTYDKANNFTEDLVTTRETSERRIFYVALTRAKKRVIIGYNKQPTNPLPHKPLYLEEIDLDNTKKWLDIFYKFKQDPDQLMKKLHLLFDDLTQIKANNVLKISLQESCIRYLKKIYGSKMDNEIKLLEEDIKKSTITISNTTDNNKIIESKLDSTSKNKKKWWEEDDEVNSNNPYRKNIVVKELKNDLDREREEDNKLIESSPTNIDALYERACLNRKKGYYKNALEDFTKLIEISSDKWKAYYNRGTIKAALKDYEGAISDYDAALTLNPEDKKILVAKGAANLALKNLVRFKKYTK